MSSEFFKDTSQRPGFATTEAERQRIAENAAARRRMEQQQRAAAGRARALEESPAYREEKARQRAYREAHGIVSEPETDSAGGKGSDDPYAGLSEAERRWAIENDELRAKRNTPKKSLSEQRAELWAEETRRIDAKKAELRVTQNNGQGPAR